MITKSRAKAEQKAMSQKLPNEPNPAPKLSRSLYEAILAIYQKQKQKLAQMAKTGSTQSELCKYYKKYFNWIGLIYISNELLCIPNAKKHLIIAELRSLPRFS